MPTTAPRMLLVNCRLNSFSHPDYTVGSGFTPDPPLGCITARVTDLEALKLHHRRLGISPDPEGKIAFIIFLLL